MNDERRTATVKIPKKTKDGREFEIEYARVADRLQEFLSDTKGQAIAIQTSCEFQDGWAMFCAEVKCDRGQFTGHSLGKTGGEKAFEKLETIAVGRALAFAGYLASGEIASFEEMQEFDREYRTEISKGQHDQLKRDWVASFGSTFPESEYADQFGAWVQQETGLEAFAVNNHREWTAADLAKCQESLGESTAAALSDAGLKKNGK